MTLKKCLEQRPKEAIDHLQILCNIPYKESGSYLLIKAVEKIYNCRNSQLALLLSTIK